MAASILSHAIEGFSIGDEVIINDRVLNPTYPDHHNDCHVAERFIGQRCIVEGTRNGKVSIKWSIYGSSHNWQLSPEYLDMVKPLTEDEKRLIVAWNLVAAKNDPIVPILRSAFETLLPLFVVPIESLNRRKGTWSELLFVKAAIRLRRTVPNNYEELKILGNDSCMSQLFSNAWQSAYKRKIQL